MEKENKKGILLPEFIGARNKMFSHFSYKISKGELFWISS